MEAITAAGYTAGPEGIAIALDPASSEMREADGTYRYSQGTRLTTDEMIERTRPAHERLSDLVDRGRPRRE